MWLAFLLACTDPVVLGVPDTGVPKSDETPAEVVDEEEDTGIAPDVCINELVPENIGSYETDDGDTPDWVELHNPVAHDVDLDGWFLSDDPDDPEKAALSGRIDEGDFLVLVQGEHFDFGLDDEGGTIMLSNPWGGGSRIDHGHVEPGFSISRTTDCCTGSGCLEFVWRGTPGKSNEG